MTDQTPMPERHEVVVDGERASYLTAGTGRTVLLLHGTYWSRVWQPVLAGIAAAGLNPVAVDLPGLGRSAGRLDLASATVPSLASWLTRFVDALAPSSLAGVAGHDIGGAITQHLVAERLLDVDRYALVNSVTYDSWPVPGVARYRDPEVVEATSAEEIVEARRVAVTAALARPASEDELADYLSPWTDLRVARSWMALAGAADPRYTLDLLDSLRADERPVLLLWGAEDTFQPLPYAERYAREMRRPTLDVVPGAGHIPMENDPDHVARSLGAFFGEPATGA